MKRRGSKRVQLKRLRFRLKLAINSVQDLLRLIQEREERETDIQVENPHTYPYRLIPLDIKPDYPDYRQIKKADPRYIFYKLRSLLGSEN